MVSRSRISPIRITSGPGAGVLERHFPAVGVEADFALGDDAVLVRVHELDRVFDGDDVAVGVFVAVVDHGRQRGRLPEPVAPTRMTRPRFGRATSLRIWGRPRPSMVGMLLRNDPHDHAHVALLHEGVDPEAPDAHRARSRSCALWCARTQRPACRS